MKLKVVLFALMLFSFSLQLLAQDYYEIRTERTVFNYPKSVGIEVMIDSAFTSDFELSQNYDEIRISAPWRDGYAIYKNAIIERIEHENATSTQKSYSNVPTLSNREIVRSTTNPNRFNLSAIFSNQVVFEYLDGVANASYKGERIPLLESKYRDSYLIEFEDFLFKLTFYPTVGRFWYVVENQHD